MQSYEETVPSRKLWTWMAAAVDPSQSRAETHQNRIYPKYLPDGEPEVIVYGNDHYFADRN